MNTEDILKFENNDGNEVHLVRDRLFWLFSLGNQFAFSLTKGDFCSHSKCAVIEAKENKFKYHYQQLKPSCCDVFIWIGVCKDELIYWVLTSEELRKTGKLGSQHRNENTGVAGIDVFEGQVFMTEEELAPYCVKECDLVSIIRLKCK